MQGKNAIYKLTEAILEEYEYYKQILKKYFNENLIMSVEDEEEKFQSSNKCWICNKLFKKKIRDHGHITGKYRSSAHSNCNIDLKLTKNVPAIFHNWTGYDGCLIM